MAEYYNQFNRSLYWVKKNYCPINRNKTFHCNYCHISGENILKHKCGKETYRNWQDCDFCWDNYWQKIDNLCKGVTSIIKTGAHLYYNPRQILGRRRYPEEDRAAERRNWYSWNLEAQEWRRDLPSPDYWTATPTVAESPLSEVQAPHPSPVETKNSKDDPKESSEDFYLTGEHLNIHLRIPIEQTGTSPNQATTTAEIEKDKPLSISINSISKRQASKKVSDEPEDEFSIPNTA